MWNSFRRCLNTQLCDPIRDTTNIVFANVAVLMCRLLLSFIGGSVASMSTSATNSVQEISNKYAIYACVTSRYLTNDSI